MKLAFPVIFDLLSQFGDPLDWQCSFHSPVSRAPPAQAAFRWEKEDSTSFRHFWGRKTMHHIWLSADRFANISTGWDGCHGSGHCETGCLCSLEWLNIYVATWWRHMFLFKCLKTKYHKKNSRFRGLPCGLVGWATGIPCECPVQIRIGFRSASLLMAGKAADELSQCLGPSVSHHWPLDHPFFELTFQIHELVLS